MSEPGAPGIGTIGWVDLTVDDAVGVRDFYRRVVGWDISEVDMGGYADYCVHPPSGEPVAGICHARGPNADLPAAWLVYLTVADLDRSLEACREGGGEVVAGPKGSAEKGRYAVIRDPAGAVAALFQPGG